MAISELDQLALDSHDDFGRAERGFELDCEMVGSLLHVLLELVSGFWYPKLLGWWR